MDPRTLAAALALALAPAACQAPTSADPRAQAAAPAPTPTPTPTAADSPVDAPVDPSAGPAPELAPYVDPGAGAIALELDGDNRRWTVLQPPHAVINAIVTPPAISVIAGAGAGSREGLTLRIGGVDLERASLPLTLHALAHEAGAPVITMTYTDAAGARHEARVDARSPANTVILDAWDPAEKRLQGRFAAEVKAPAGGAHQLRGGAFNVVLSDPFAGRPGPNAPG